MAGIQSLRIKPSAFRTISGLSSHVDFYYLLQILYTYIDRLTGREHEGLHKGLECIKNPKDKTIRKINITL